ncbi:MAG: bifunctional metallophosphatase/5'-nucleotidase [Oscillochloridaceae bacterium umkhey_bin13]
MRKLIALMLGILFALGFAITPLAAQSPPSPPTAVTLFHFSDYHSHAVPFYSEGQPDQGGVARAIGYLRQFADDPRTLIFNGGDMLNLNVPAWGVKYTCIEWPWFNGIVDAMAFGNHDADYGAAHFADCVSRINYPILGANVLDPNGQPLFLHNGKNYLIFEIDGIKIGVFALAGPDFDRLVPANRRPVEGATFGDPVATARDLVRTLREDEGVQAVISIGHGHFEDDLRLAQQVPGIDLIFGTHSHLRRELEVLPGTTTYSISPYQYLTYISRVELQFQDGRLSSVNGALVPVNASMPADPVIAQQVAQLQADLEADPQFAPLFVPIGSATVELSDRGKLTGETVLGNFVMDIFRQAANSHVALSTASSFREPLPPGPVTEEALRTALPFANKILVFSMQGALLQELLDYSVARSGFDFFSQVSGVRFNIVEGRATNVQVLVDPANPAAGFAPLDPAATYQVATTDFQGLIAAGYRELFARAAPPNATGIDVRDQVRAYLQANSPVSAALDGRITLGPPPAPPAVPVAPVPVSLPSTAGAALPLLALAMLGLLISLTGLALRRRS